MAVFPCGGGGKSVFFSSPLPAQIRVWRRAKLCFLPLFNHPHPTNWELLKPYRGTSQASVAHPAAPALITSVIYSCSWIAVMERFGHDQCGVLHMRTCHISTK